MSYKPLEILTAPSRFLNRLSERFSLAGTFGVAAFMEATVFPLMIDAFMLSLYLQRKSPMWKLVAVGALASLLGTALFWCAGFLIGAEGLTSFAQNIGITQETITSVQTQWSDNWVLTTFIVCLSALPDPILAFYAGTSQTSIFLFLPVLAAALLTRFLFLGIVVWAVSHLFASKETMRHAVSGASLALSLVVGIIGVVTFLL